MNRELEADLNKQVNEEVSSSYIYLSMAAYFESLNLPGFAHWMRIQTQEETMHAMMFFDYVIASFPTEDGERLDDLVEAIGLPKERLCTFCFDGCEGCD